MDINQTPSGILAETEKLKDANIELELSLQKLIKAQEKSASGADKFSRAYQDNAVQLRKTEAALKSNNEQIDKNIKMLDMAKDSLEKNKATLESLKAQYVSLTSSQGDNANGASKLNTQIGLLAKTVDDQEKKLIKSRKVFDAHKASMDALENAFGKVKNSNNDFGSVLDDVAKGFNSVKSGIDVVKTGFTSVGAAIKTTGFGLLLLVLESLTEYFTTDKTGIKQFRGAMAAIGLVIDKIKKAFGDLRRAIAEAIMHPGETIKKLWNEIVENIGNRFKSLGVIIDGILHFNPKKIADGVLQLGTGITNATDKIKNGFTILKDEVVKTAKDAAVAFNNAYDDAGKKTITKVRRKIKNHEKPITPRSVEFLQAKGTDLTKQIEEDKKAYDMELAQLNEQLSKKLISEEEYNKKSEALKEQYHQGISLKTKEFAEKDMAEMQKHLRDIAEKEKNDATIASDEKNVSRALMPGAKLQAEKQLITDKYNYEIVLANGNAEKIKELETKKQEALSDLSKQYEQQRKEFALNTAQQVADKAFSIIGNNIKSASDAKIRGLENDKANELINKSLTATQRKAIEDKYKKKENEEKVKAFKAEQRMSVLQALVNGALAITKVTSQTGVLSPFVIPGIIASTALQIATIVAQKPPAFAKGGQFVSDGRGALLPGYSRTDNTNAYLRSGEAVVVSEAMRNPWARNLVSAINVAHGGRDFSVPNTGRGYAIGGIFTDGGNANRYYNQPVNDIKDMANTLAYQMINNFPPIYVDVKDVNNQQNILAQTVNRVNL